MNTDLALQGEAGMFAGNLLAMIFEDRREGQLNFFAQPLLAHLFLSTMEMEGCLIWVSASIFRGRLGAKSLDP